MLQHKPNLVFVYVRISYLQYWLVMIFQKCDQTTNIKGKANITNVTVIH